MIVSSKKPHECQLCATGRQGEPAEHSLKKHAKPKKWPGAETRTLVQQGPVENRIDLTMVGDGYTPEQKEQFFSDAQRLASELFEGKTFNSYLPLFNVHAVFVPSKESGLSDGDRKNTALGLFRSPEGSKRAIQVRRPGEADKALQLAPDTDYPILIANDKFYGGLGGRYAITTSSPESGSMVLRHELGHNFGLVGEEYDGGQVYKGANHSASSKVPWSHWADGEIKPEKASSLLASYPWKNLKDKPLNYTFNVPTGQTLVALDVSSVGWQSPQDVEVLLDGQPVPLQGVFTEDRSFFRSPEPFATTPGKHTLTIRETTKDGNNVVGSVKVLAFDPDYDFTDHKVGAFPTFDDHNQLVGYRPTHDSCLMRDMRHEEFCPIDKENMWHKFLQRVTLIDSLQASAETVQLQTPKLEGLDIRWYTVQGAQEQEIKELAGRPQWTPEPGTSGDFRARVSFLTPEVRVYDEKFAAVRDFQIAPT